MRTVPVTVLVATLLLVIAGVPAQPAFNETPVEVPFSLFRGASAVAGSLSPRPTPAGAPEKILMPGNPLTGTKVIPFVTGEASEAVTITGTVTVELWAQSDDNPRNAYFRVQLVRDDGLIYDIGDTPKQNLGSSPVKFVVSASPTLTLAANGSLSLQFTFFADLVPAVPFPKPADSYLLFGVQSTPSHVKLRTMTFRVSLTEPDTGDVVTFRGLIRELFLGSGGTYTATWSVLGPKGPLAPPYLAPPENGTVANGTEVWIQYNFKVDPKASSGRYKVTLTAGYDEALTFGNSSTYDVRLPPKTPGGEPFTLGGFLGPAIAIGLGVVLLLYLLHRYRKGPFAARPTRPAGKREGDAPPRSSSKDDEER